MRIDCATRSRLLSAPLLALLLWCTSAPAAEIHSKFADVLSPPAFDDGWKIGNVVAAGFDQEGMVQLAKALNDDQYSNVHAVLVEHNGKLVYEQYLSGSDEQWGRSTGPIQFDRGMLHDVRSITKSVTSLLLGIALQSGYAQALDRPVLDYFPDRKSTVDPRLDSVTLRHVLTMTAGISWNEMTVPYGSGKNDENRMYGEDDPVGFVLSRPLRDAPGERWYYNGGLTMVVAGVVQELTDQPFVKYAHDALFQPLDITSFSWYGPESWRASGMPSAASGLRLRARDLAKIGSLFLNGGRWQGQQIVPKEWVELSGHRYREDVAPWDDDGTYGYGYQWWHGLFNVDGESFAAITAMGLGGQRVFILPDERIVVTIFSGNYDSGDWWKSERVLKRIIAARR